MKSRLFFYVFVLILAWKVVGQAPTVTGNTSVLQYTEGDGAVVIDATVTPNSNRNNDRLNTGYVGFSSGYNADEDSIYIDLATSPVNFTYEADIGRISFTSGARETEYQEAMRAIKYINKSSTPNVTDRVIEFVVTDGNGTSTPFERTIQITAVNDAPWLYDGNTSNQVDTLVFSALEDHPKTITPTIFDPEGDDFTISFEGLANSSGSITVSGDAKSFEYTPNTNFNGTEYVSINICEAVNTDNCRESVIQLNVAPVNDLPFMYSGSIDNPTDTLTYEATEDQVLNICPTISDPDGDELEVKIQGLANDNGTAVTSADKGCFDFTPNFNFNGVEYVSISICEVGGAQECVSAVIRVNVAAVNDAPYLYFENTNNKVDTLTFIAVEDQAKIVTPTIDDPEGDDYEISLVGLSNSSGEVSVSEDLKSFEYMPNANYNGTEYVVINICDVNDSNSCNEAVIQLNIEPVNDAPIIENNGASVDSIYFGTGINESIVICLEASDLEGDQTSISSVEGPYLLGQVDSIAGMCFKYIPGQDSVGSEFLKVFVCDDAGVQKCDSVIVQVQFPIQNTAPYFENINNQDTISRGVLVAEMLTDSIEITDRERDVLVIDTAYAVSESGAFSAAISGNYFKYTFEPEVADSLTSNTIFCKVCDDRPNALCDSLVIEVAVNYPPVLLDAGGTIISAISDSLVENTTFNACYQLFDFNNQSIFNSSISSSGNGTLTANPDNQSQELCLTYEPQADFTGVEDFSITLCDNGTPESCTVINVSYTVFETNTSPVIESINESKALLFDIMENDSINSCLSFSDAQGDSVFVQDLIYLSGPGSFTTSVNQDDSTLCVEYLPTIYEFGTYEASMVVCDDNPFPICDTISVSIDLEPVNLDPIVLDDDEEISESISYEFQVLLNDSDPENEGLFISDLLLGEEPLGNATFTDDLIIYDPFPDEYKGTDTLLVTVCDRGTPQVCLESQLRITLLLPIPELEVYEAFSPNGDGVNDTWFIDGIREFPNNSVRILDQYGKIIWQVSGYDNRSNIWKGERDGPGSSSEVEDGTYYYSIDLGVGDDPLTGFVILKR